MDPADIDDGIYNFLSVSLDEDDLNAPKKEGEASRQIVVKEDPAMKSEQSNLSLDEQARLAIKPTKNYKNIIAPEWFRKGQGIELLLQEAEELDWSQDVQNMISQNEQAKIALNTIRISTPAERYSTYIHLHEDLQC